MNPPIPKYTIANLCGSIGDVLRAAAAWGAASVGDQPADAELALVSQTVMQLLTLALQREPTEAEMLAVIGG